MNELRIFLCLLMLVAWTDSHSQQADHVPGQAIVMLEPGSRIETLLQQPGRRAPVFRHEKILSQALRIHLLSFDSNGLAENEALATLKKQPGVLLAQFNHYVEMRSTEATFPNDPSFSGQWALHNTGQNGGTPDADIDAPEAWDLTTGGLSALGDTIVIAIVDGGADLAHEDLIFWKNRAEIPGNGIDDDGNGYLDDYDGWNAFNSTGNLSSDLHGTGVTSVAAGKGNNATGVAGLNWHTQVMPIEASASTESVVIEGYGYVYEMRKRYNQSNGAQGAFIVVANSSFGFNFGMPANFPIWCAMYDSLGQIGVISVGSTTNGSVDVDAQGDMPSTCPSDYLIAVTNTTRNDQKRPAAGYGLTHIDLGAPGTDILTAIPNNLYNTDTGTSLSAPFVSGTIALMYAAACPEFMALYKDHPAAMAPVIRSLLLQGVDTLVSLQGLTATSGRLNAYKSLLKILEYCAGLPDCLPPFDLAAGNLTDSSSLITWTATGPADSFLLQYRPLGSSLWISDTTTTLSLQLGGLDACTDYELRMASLCSDSSSAFSQLFFFSSEGCCVPPASLSLDNLTETTLALRWPAVYAAQAYRLQYRTAGDSLWLDRNTGDTLAVLNNLNPCTRYELRLETLCDTGWSGFAPVFVFNTLGCGACLDLVYCQSKGNNSSDEWIESVSIGGFANLSGNDGGFGDFTASGPLLLTGAPVDVQLVPEFAGFPFNEYWRIWIDLNQDGDFDDPGERVFDAGAASNDTVSGQFVLPFSATDGATRMRVSMKFFSSFGGAPPLACETFDFGEVEDYCVTIVEDLAACETPTSLVVDSLGEDFARLRWNPAFNANGYLLQLFSDNLLLADTSITGTQFFWESLNTCTPYALRIAAVCDSGMSAFSDSLYVTLPGCNACLDLPYCPSAGQNVQDEWIAAFAIDTFVNVSGSDLGYGDHTTLPLQLARSGEYAVTLAPGFASMPFDEHWRIWIDLDQNGDFSGPGEQVYDSGGGSTDTLHISLVIPPDAAPGPTRMRLSMRFDSPPDACGPVDFGEVEDYCLDILVGAGLSAPVATPRIRLSPNPAAARVRIESDAPLHTVEVLDVFGRRILHQSGLSQPSVQVDVSGLARGVYLVRVSTANGVGTGRLRVW